MSKGMWAMNHETRRGREMTSEGYIVGSDSVMKESGRTGFGI